MCPRVVRKEARKKVYGAGREREGEEGGQDQGEEEGKERGRGEGDVVGGREDSDEALAGERQEAHSPFYQKAACGAPPPAQRTSQA